MSIKNKPLRLPVIKTSFLAKIVKNFMFLRAQTTARVRNKQTSVFTSKYPKYCASGGTIKQVTTASRAAIQKTKFFFRKEGILILKLLTSQGKENDTFKVRKCHFEL